jgi:hypothetical protein
MLADVTASEAVPAPPALTPRPVAASLDELLADATDRHPFAHSDSKSGVGFEHVTIDGEPHIVKHVHIDDDWTMRFFHETTCIPLEVWRAGLMDVAPDHVEHGVVAVAGGLGRDGLGAALLMRDLGDALVPAGDDPISLEDHLALLDALAALAARMWGWQGDDRLLPFENRWVAFGDDDIDAEEARGFPDPVPRIAQQGWSQFVERAPRAARDIVLDLRRDLSPLVAAVATTPRTFLHGDWKMGNLGVTTDRRAVLLDWTYCGSGPVCHELGWYLAINNARLPHSKEDAIDALRHALERHGVATDGWWERQRDLCLLGSLVQFGWEKALGDDDELGWWCDRAREGARHL